MYNYYGSSSGGLSKNLPQIFGLIVLVVALLFLLVNFGYMRACDLPGFEKVYYGIRGYPRIAIVSGVDGTGNPEELRSAIIDRAHQFPMELSVSDLLTGGVLDNYDLVIVEHAKTMDSRALASFRDYVKKGGKLVWIGDAGSRLSDTDYLCKEVSFSFLPAYEQMMPKYDENGSTVVDENGQAVLVKKKVCGQWTDPYTPDSPSELNAGLCAHDFPGLVMKFIEENESYYKQATSGSVTLCNDESITRNPYQVKNAEDILNCIAKVESNTGKSISEITSEDVHLYCDSGVNYWDRGASKSSTNKITRPINFGSTVLGADYVGQLNEEQGSNLFLTPVANHLLIRGYESSVSADWFGVGNFTIVDTTGYEFRTKVIMNLKLGDNFNGVSYPAIFVSNPVGPSIGTNGLVIYYAFPPEELIKEGRGLNLIDNLLEFTLCLK